MLDENELRGTILEYVKDEYLDEEDETEVGPDTPIITTGIVDSFSMTSLKSFLERKYDIAIPDAKATTEAFDTVNRIVQLVKEVS